MSANLELLAKIAVDCGFKLHDQLGPGLLESAYEECLCHELSLRKVSFERQIDLPVRYKGVNLDCGYRLDLLIGKKVIVELKTVESLLPIHEAQLLTYLKMTNCKLGLLLNFNAPLLRNGIKRLANNL